MKKLNFNIVGGVIFFISLVLLSSSFVFLALLDVGTIPFSIIAGLSVVPLVLGWGMMVSSKYDK